MGVGEPDIKRALKWILDRLADDPNAKRSNLIDQAAREFDLSPLEADFLYRQLAGAAPPEGPPQTPGA